MFSTALNRIAVGTVLALASYNGLSAEYKPRVLREPVLGLRYESAKVKFESVPLKVQASCESLRDNENGRGVWYVYAQASDASGRSFYVIGGYEIRYNETGRRNKYSTDDFGVLLYTEGDSCTDVDSARQVFDDRIFDSVPQPILSKLASDLAKRLVRAYGGAGRLRAELQAQHIDPEELPAELHDAMKPYLSR
ncbi:hypothetical protein [Massilia horti]|uniref:Uncharacterized protein n=1 Tax=Massilia horti TaxID=2562153 RepID=A0A4Y9SU44_9BURK|nr:hypothetical protein [Massilia horti]TFW28276.1 hypothetical protein E4O92_21745 [Massilia horti]